MEAVATPVRDVFELLFERHPVVGLAALANESIAVGGSVTHLSFSGGRSFVIYCLYFLRAGACTEVKSNNNIPLILAPGPSVAIPDYFRHTVRVPHLRPSWAEIKLINLIPKQKNLFHTMLYEKKELRLNW